MERTMTMSKQTKKKSNEMSEETITQEEQLEVEQLSELEQAYQTISNLQKQLDESKNEYLKAYADTQNIRKRLMADFENKSKFAIKSFALDILAVIDNLQRALADQNQDLESWRKGIEMIHQQLIEALEKEGVSKIDAQGEVFDPNMHHAIATEETETVEPNTVVEVFQNGYMIKDKLLRPSVVKVSERKSEEE